MKPITRIVVIVIAVFFAWQMTRPLSQVPQDLIFQVEPWRKYFLLVVAAAFGSIATYNFIKLFVGWREDYD